MNKSIILISFSLSLLLSAFVNCSGSFEAVQANGSQSSSSVGGNGGAAGGGSSPGPAGGLAVSSVGSVDMNLSAESEFKVTVSSTNSFSGSATLSLDKSGLSGVVGAEDITAEFTPASVSLSANGSAEVTVKIKTKSSAPSFDATRIAIKATASGAAEGSSAFDLKVNPVVELKMFGGPVPEQRWDQPKLMQFRSHTGGLTVRFINYNTESTHIVHGGGSIRHQPTGSPLAAAAAEGQAGGAYEVTIDDTVTNDGIYYYHDLGDSGNRGTMQFNLTQVQLQSTSALRVVASAAESNMDSSQEDVKGSGSCHGGD